MRFIYAVLALFFFVGAATAQSADQAIQNYNAARSGGDPALRIQTAIELGHAAIANPDRSDAQTLAFEAAQTLCLIDDCKGALPFTDWLLQMAGEPQGAQPGDEAILAAYSAWSAKPNKKNRKALDAALDPITTRQPSLLSVTIFQKRYVSDLQKDRWLAGKTSAEAAAVHFESAKDVIGSNWSDAVTSSLVAAFNQIQREETVLAMASHEGRLKRMHGEMQSASATIPDWVDDHRYRATAWRMAMAAYFLSENGPQRSKQLDTKIDEVLGELADPDLPPPTPAQSGDTQPFCGGTFDMKPKLSYPRGAGRKGLFGAALMRISVTDGKVSAVEPLAAVPYEGFKDHAAQTIMKWSWVPSDPGAGVTCTLNNKNIELPLVFALR